MSSGSAPLSNERGYECLSGGGESGAYLRALDWSRTSLGPVHTWPQSLRTSVSICLNSAFAILVWWGPELVMLYNDAYSAIVSEKHPKALGSPGREIFPEVWQTIGPMLEAVMKRGEAVRADDLLLSLVRNGYAEECYFTFSYSPILDESGGVGGVFTPVQETTERVIGERRLRTLSSLAAVRAGKARNAEEACTMLAAAFALNPYDLPSAAIYLLDETGQTATRVAAAGTVGAEHMTPERIDGATEWPPLATIINGETAILDRALQSPAAGAVAQWAALPLAQAGGGLPKGFVVAALNPYKRLDDSYRSFIALVADHIAATIADAESFEQQRKRAEALADLDRAKTTFFSNVSHEFRTPLTLMLGPIESMLEHPPNPGELSGQLKLVHRNGLRLLKLVNTLLDFARIEAGRIRAAYEATDLARLTSDTASAFRSAMDQAGLDYVIDCDALDQETYVDRDMWEKIVLNLVSNAFKFTLSGRIAVRLKPADNRIKLIVEDTGTGIPAHELPKIFDRFHRVEGARGRTHEGTGIGLALVHELVKLHGGTLAAESAENEGTRFTVSIPTGHAHLPAEHLVSAPIVTSTGIAASAYVDEALRWLPVTEEPASTAHAFASDTVQAPHVEKVSGRILLADDNADMREYVRRLLGPHYQVQSVSNGIQALDAARSDRPDLILTDVMMPGVDGFQLLRELRAHDGTSTIPVILLSARAGEDARIEGLEAGADDYIVKPFTARELLARVGAHLAMSRLRREAAEHERTLREETEAAHERTMTFLESISDSFMAVDRDWRFTYVNSEAERTMGLAREDVLGKAIWDVFPHIKGSYLEEQYVRAMNERIPIRIDHFSQPKQRWFELRVYPAKDGGLSVFYQDITQRIDANEALKRSEKLAAAGRLAATVAHDLNNPLTIAMNLLYLAQREGNSEVQRSHLLGAERELQRVARLANRSLSFYRGNSPRGEVPIALLVRELVEVFKPGCAAKSIEIRVDVEDELLAYGSKDELAQVVTNLLSNAVDAVKHSGKITVRCKRFLDRHNQREMVRLVVADNGPGVERVYRKRLFEPFFTTKNDAGTGLGLWITKEIVSKHMGVIRLRTRTHGKRTGTVASVLLPLKAPAEAFREANVA